MLIELRLNWKDFEGELAGTVVHEVGSALYRDVNYPSSKYLVENGRVYYCDENRTTRMDDLGPFDSLYIA